MNRHRERKIVRAAAVDLGNRNTITEHNIDAKSKGEGRVQYQVLTQTRKGHGRNVQNPSE